MRSCPILGATAILVGLLAPALAADLQPPRALDTARPSPLRPPGPGCPVGASGIPFRGAPLVVRDALRADVGPYKVELPGYSTGAENAYRPFLVRAQPGQTLRFRIRNELPSAPKMADAVSLHTHGLIVSPRRCPPFGDSVYVEDPAGATADWAITIPAKLPGAMFAGGGADQRYPSGLAWFHAHVHGKARIDVMGGQSGLLQVGDSLADLKATLGLSTAAKAVLEHTDAVYLGLRDIQLRVARSATPDKLGSSGAVATWLKGADYSPGACPSQANPPQAASGTPSTAVPGSCFSADAGSDPPTSTEWLFTVNGQAFPADRMAAGRNQLLRIANLSANASYLIQVVADAAPGQPLPLDVITIDGLVAGTAPQGGSGLKVGVTLDSLSACWRSRSAIATTALWPAAA